MAESLAVQLGLRITSQDAADLDAALSAHPLSRRQDVARHALRLGLRALRLDGAAAAMPIEPRNVQRAHRAIDAERRALEQATDDYVEALVEGLRHTDGNDAGWRRGRRSDREQELKQREALELFIEEARTVAKKIHARKMR